MAGLKEIQCELPQKPWINYSPDEINSYCLRNLKKTDCSFVGADQENSNSAKVHKSFKWILWEMSPVLKEILNDKENQEKDCKEIVVSKPKYIEAILFYAHFKVVDTDIMNLLDFYECSKEYQIKALEVDVIKMFNSEENQKKANWVKLFWLSYVKHPEDQQMRAVFEKVKGHVDCYEKVAEANLDLILEFDEAVFGIFFEILCSRNLQSRFKITEAFLIKHYFHGNKNKKLEEMDPLERNLVAWYMHKMNLTNQLCWDNYKNGPLASNLLTTKRKIADLEYFKNIRYSDSTYNKMKNDEIQSYTQKLRKAESKIKTENKP